MELVIEGLSKRYANGVQALHGVSLSLSPGMFGLLGPNGAGKSSLMRTLATLQEADAGSVRLGDLDVLRDKEGVRRVLGYLPQDFGLYPKVTALDLLGHFAALKGIPGRHRSAVVEGLLRRTNLWEARGRRVGTFSGGMRQRFGIAQALLGSPKLLIVDEPTAGLDPEERVRFHNLLADIGEDVVVILSTHIVEDVADLCPRMAVLVRGKVVASGEPSVLTRGFAGKVYRRELVRGESAADLTGVRVLSTKRVAGKSAVHVYADGPPGAGFEPVEATLEDVYFHAVGQSAHSGKGASNVA